MNRKGNEYHVVLTIPGYKVKKGKTMNVDKARNMLAGTLQKYSVPELPWYKKLFTKQERGWLTLEAWSVYHSHLPTRVLERHEIFLNPKNDLIRI